MRRAFTLVETLAVALAATMVLGYFSIADVPQSREMANRGTCAANLRGLVQAMSVYGASENDWFPCPPTPGTASAYDAAFSPEGPTEKAPDRAPHALSTASDNKRPGSPTQALWMIATNGSVATKQFLCKSDPFAKNPAALSPAAGANAGTMYQDFQNEKNLSYSMAYPWTVDQNNKVIVSQLWRSDTDASLPVLSDMAPYLGSKAKAGEAATRPAGDNPNAPVDANWAVTKANSQNHQFEGQNVAYDDCHVDFVRTPVAGQINDSIWGIQRQSKGTWNAQGIWNPDAAADRTEIPIEAGTLPHPPMGSQGQQDVVMVPTRDAGGHLK